EIERALDFGVALERRVRGDAVISFDRKLRLLHRFIKVGEREKRERMARLEVNRKLEIDEADVLAALAAERSAKTEQRFRSSRGGRFHHQGERLAGVQLLHRLIDERMVREELGEIFVHFLRFIDLA